jgi:hypothetical protein
VFDAGAAFGLFDLISLTLTLSGLLVTWRQTIKAKGAAEQARDAVQGTAAVLGKNQLMLSLSLVQQIIGDIEGAANAENKDVMVFSLVRFGVASREASELLSHVSGEHGNLDEQLRELGGGALDIKSALSRSTSVKVSKTTDALRSRLASLNLEIAAANVRFRFDTTGAIDAN